MNSLLYKNSLVSRSILPSVKSKTIVQPKLSINVPGDQYEQEADEMAERVMRMPANENNYRPKTGIIGASLQRKCTECEEEEKRRKLIMRKAEGRSFGIQASPSLVSSLNTSKGGGSPLPQGTKSFMENAFSTDFSSVRIHADSQAAEMSKGINAKAFTHGSDIYFNSDQYAIKTEEGRRLLAHELTHTIQQTYGLNRMLMRQGGGRGTTGVSGRQSIISNARRGALARVTVAYLRINGTSPQFNRSGELQTVRGLVAPDIVNFDQIVEIVGSILSKLSSDNNIQIGPEIAECRGSMGWNAYVTGNRLPIHLCERFFRLSAEQQIRTLIHEAAHATGIGEPSGESYFPVFDCSTSTADNWNVADAWARYINCISGQTPDSPQPITGRAPAHP